MSKRDLRLFVTDMLEAIENVERYTAGLSLEQFGANDMAIDAVVRNLEIIGEAAAHLHNAPICLPHAPLRKRKLPGRYALARVCLLTKHNLSDILG